MNDDTPTVYVVDDDADMRESIAGNESGSDETP